MNKVKRILVSLAACFMAVIYPMSAMAATGTALSSVSIRINSYIEAGDSSSDVSVTISSTKYSLEDYEVTNEPSDEWDNGDKPKLKITLEASDGYYFASGFSKSGVNLTGDDDSTATSVSRSSSSKLIVYVTLEALEGDGGYDLDVEGLEWDEANGVASWYETEDAKKYEVRLYRGTTAVTSVITTSSLKYNFAQYFTAGGSYTFKVRAVYSSSTKGDWVTSDAWYASASEAKEILALASSSGTSTTTSTGISDGPGATQSTQGAWLKDDIGWWYCNADKSYTVNNWQYINNVWYFFDERGYMKTGWIDWNSKWYYLDDNGAMQTNTVTPDGYTVDSNGVWV